MRISQPSKLKASWDSIFFLYWAARKKGRDGVGVKKSIHAPNITQQFIFNFQKKGKESQDWSLGYI